MSKEALEGSIKKWQDIVDGIGEDLGMDNCPLCKQYFGMWAVRKYACEGCPVFASTERNYCKGSPYDEWSDYYRSCAKTNQLLVGKVFNEKSKQLAQNMLDFLISLRGQYEKSR